MTTHPRSPEPSPYLRFAALSLGVSALLVVLGWIPTRRWGGAEAGPALVVGCGVSLAAALLGGLVIVRTEARNSEGPQALFSALKAMGVRLAVLLGLGTAAALSGVVALTPFLLWTGISYLALLPVETRYALAAVEETVAEQASGGIREGRDEEKKSETTN